MFAWGLGRLTVRLLEEHDVTRAHIAAPHVLAAWQAHDARYWRSTFFSLALGAAVPLLGCLLLGWTPGVMLAALTADVMALWLCDGLKQVLASHRVEEERAHQAEAYDVLAVIRALERPRRPTQRDLLAPAPRPQLYLSVAAGGAMSSWDRKVMYGLALFLMSLVALVIAVSVPAAAPWLFAAAVLRVGLSALRTLRARRDSGPRPDLLPESGIPTMALYLAVYPAVMFCLVFDVKFREFEAQGLALVMLGLHVAIAGWLAWLGVRRVRRTEEDLRAFAARDREQLRARVRQVNG